MRWTPKQLQDLRRGLDAAYPDARCALDHRDPFQLVVATILSAQCTDARVNLTTPALFARYPDAARLAAADLADVDPVRSQPDFVAALQNRLFTGGDNHVIVNGLTKRFERGFSIVVVGISGGNPRPKGPVGVIVVPANSSSIYKFYKAEGEDTWRRL